MNAKVDIKSLKGITQDSRGVKTGYLFAALPGSKLDGCDYIADAVRNGASAILAPKGTVMPDLESAVDVALIVDENPRRALALIASEFYARQSEDIVAVTGTNGKTSVVYFAEQLWKSQGVNAASLGTLGVPGVSGVSSGNLTTPGPVQLHATLADLAAAGIAHLALEASSHGLDQYRLDGIKVRAAGFTNLSHDHLDYHGDLDSYRVAKLRLFTDVLQDNGTAVLNADSADYESFRSACEEKGHKIISYGFAGEDLKILQITSEPQGQNLKLRIFGQDYEVTLHLVGVFQVMNALCALGLVLAEDQTKRDDYVRALEALHGAPGRLQFVNGHPKGAAIYVDYAHTPDALEQVLKALRPHTSGRLCCIFGCGGNRDEDKRAVMGGIATAFADVQIVTDDNPRNENPEEIRAAILSTAPNGREIGDRREAIEQTIRELEDGDVLLIAGKGHEQGQVFAGHTDPFDDVKEAEKAIEGMKAK